MCSLDEEQLVCVQKVSIFMSSSTHDSSFSENQSTFPAVRILYECVVKERTREATSCLYEIACSITYPVLSGHLSIRVTGQNTYRNAPAREVSFTRHEAGATTYVELLEREQLEVRIIEHEGPYSKVIYYAHERTLIELNARRVISTIQRVDSPSDVAQNGN